MYDDNPATQTVRFTATPCAHLRRPIFPDEPSQQYWNALWEARLKVFTKVFPWVHSAVMDLAGLPADTPLGIDGKHEHNRAFNDAHDQYMLGARSNSDKVRAIHERQNREWEALTNIPPLGTPDDWRTAAIRAGANPPEVFGADDFQRYAGCIVAWALDRQANRSGESSVAIGGKLAKKDSPTPKRFDGGAMVFFPDRVELCGVIICSGNRSLWKRRILESLSTRGTDGQFMAYSGKKLRAAAGITRKDVASAIRDVRDGIAEALLKGKAIRCERNDVIISRDHGYRLSQILSVQDGSDLNKEPKGAGGGASNGPNVTNRDVTNVPNDPNADVPNVPSRAVPIQSREEAAATKRRTWILEQLAAHKRIKANDIAKQFECARETAKRDLKQLIIERKIEFVGSKRRGHYRLIEPPPTL